MRKILISGALVMLALAGHPSRRVSDVDAIAGRLQRLAQEGDANDRATALSALDALARQYRRQAEVESPEVNSLGLNVGANRCWRMLVTLKDIGDKRSLPLFEEMTASTDKGIRTTAVIGYMNVAEVLDTLPFIERLMKNPHYTVHEHSDVYRLLKERVEASPPEDMAKICAFLLEKTQTEQKMYIVELMDDVLAKHLHGYATSVQRAEAAEKFVPTDNEYRKYWAQRKEEIKGVPAHERKDFRAKGELLDPERKGM